MRYRAAAIAAALALVAATAVYALAPLGATSQIFLPALSSTGNSQLAVPPADAASARLRVPAGFAVRIFAAGLSGPRLMAIGPDGQLYAAERGAGRVVRLPDRDRDGLADAAEQVAGGLSGVHSLEWRGDALYVALSGQVARLEDLNADGDMDDAGERQTIVSGLPSDGGHSTRTARIGPDAKLYVVVGSKCNIPVDGCSEGDPRRAAILRYNLDGSIPSDNPYAGDADPNRRPVWAAGLRNAVDFLFTDGGRLWATHNGSDGLGNDTPPEEIVIDVQKGRHYGWPYCYTAQRGAIASGAVEAHDTRVPFDSGVPSCDVTTPALFTDGAHQAPLGIAAYTGAGVPAAYAGSMLVAYHGSWNADQTPRDCRVQRIVVQGGTPVSAEAFLTGFRDNDQQECGGAWGRPAGVTVGARGEVFVSDDKNGNIYRIVYTGP